MRVRPIFAWYDLWIGVFVDRPKKRLYVFPIPCFGLIIEWGRREYGVGVLGVARCRYRSVSGGNLRCVLGAPHYGAHFFQPVGGKQEDRNG